MATPNDDSKAAVGEAGIDAEDHHRTVILRGEADAFLRARPPAMSGTRPSVHPLNVWLKATDDAVVLLWGDRHELRRALADARARLEGLEAQMADRARTDACTGVLTLEAFRGDAEAVLAHAARAEQPASLALVDIDGFRSLNARRGPAAGDAALLAVAERLRSLTRESDVIGRTGADEVAVLMPSTRLRGARTCCERLIAELDGSEIPGAGFITVSAGVATHRAGTDDRAPAGRRRARPGSRPRRRRRPRRGPAAEGGVNPFRAQAHVIEALATALARARPLHGRALRLRRRDGQDRRGAPSASTRSRSSASATRRCCTTSARSAMPDRVLHKPGPLAGEEWDVMREHPVVGERILRAIPGMGCVARIVRHEHERFDGTGYPDRLRGEEIPLGSRIILACDAYHAMTSDRPYRAAHGARATRSPSSCAAPARSSTRASSPPSSGCLGRVPSTTPPAAARRRRRAPLAPAARCRPSRTP